MSGLSLYGLSIAIATIAIMITIGGIALGLGFSLNNNKLKDFGKEELFQSIINGALVGGFVVLFLPNGPITGIVNELTLSEGTAISCPSYVSQNYAICFAYNYLSGSGYTMSGVYHPSILFQSNGLVVGFLGLNAILGAIAGLNLNLAFVSISLSAAINPIINEIQVFVKTLTAISISVLTQSSILLFVSTSATGLLLPIGLVLRTFYATRRIGGFLIAVAISLYIIFPMTYVLNANILGSYTSSTTNSSIVQLTSYSGGLQGQILSSDLNSNKLGVVTGIIQSVSGALSSINSTFSSITTAIINVIAYFIIAAFILPAFSIMLTVISIRELSMIFGSEINLGLFNMV
ncbi:MAG: hypothetical protein KGH64_03585 [Candidatus Micrarchaeota archaeon]|nr:hypothetical protein [Candidatus Micrarchaeota archaeon]MDE1834392.1 hypothetical protein [Candidatus Micrarchaeota archaeon]